MTIGLKTPVYSLADRLGDQLVRPQGTGHGRGHCRGELGRQICAERSACALRLRQLKEPKATAMTLPRVGANPCRYRKEIVR